MVEVRLRTAFNTDLVGQNPWKEATGSYSIMRNKLCCTRFEQIVISLPVQFIFCVNI